MRPPRAVLTLDEFLSRPHQVQSVKRATEGGRELVYVDLTVAVAEDWERLQLWFDPQVNYLVRKQVEHYKPKGFPARPNEQEVVRFREVAPGIYFPERIEGRFFIEERQESTMVRTFSDIRVNQPLPPDTFQFRFPPGIEVLDDMQKKMFRVDSEGRLMEMKDKRVLSPSSFPPGMTVSPRSVTREEPASATRWLLLVSLLLLGLAGIGYGLRKRRQRAATLAS